MVNNLRLLDLNLLLVFDALMQEQNLSRAAVRLHMSQPAVSNSLARLREQLGEPLFQRTARGMSPLPQAQALYGPVRQALQLLQAGLGPQEGFDPQREHVFKLSMNDYGQTRLLPVLLARLQAFAPKVVISVVSDEADTLPRRLAAGSVDLAIDYLHFDDADLVYQPLYQEELVVIGRAGHPAFAGGLSWQDYLDCRHVSLLTRAGRGSPLEILLGSARIRRQVQLYVPYFLTIPEIAAHSDLLGTIPRRLAEHYSRMNPLSIAPLPMDMSRIQVSLIRHRQHDLVPGLRWLREQILSAAEDEINKL
ncbi:MAG: LysR family transcriptional regulator [Fluviicoccus sp.]|uniref:LysR family transcriptional regulator BsrA n=1 Tax=Fluviicoccus sp. TaxID=2003552 RepID=UPI002721345B|nr:LysR family transcriptional regulator [Fluviicoccus sp.]MDO8330959.1 LysR family transcriptional regulator [Fluviicoccus sp.]